jgi:hypothetical protein
MTRTARLLSAIPDAPTLWPLWFWPHCEVCGKGCEQSCAPERNNEPVLICLGCSRDVAAPVWKFVPLTDGGGLMDMHNGDLADPRNLHLLWMVAEQISRVTKDNVELVHWGSLRGYRLARYKAAVQAHCANADTPSEALFSACEAALGLEAWVEDGATADGEAE